MLLLWSILFFVNGFSVMGQFFLWQKNPYGNIWFTHVTCGFQGFLFYKILIEFAKLIK